MALKENYDHIYVPTVTLYNIATRWKSYNEKITPWQSIGTWFAVTMKKPNGLAALYKLSLLVIDWVLLSYLTCTCSHKDMHLHIVVQLVIMTN